MCKVLPKDTIEMEIMPRIRLPRRGFALTVPLCKIVNVILYKLKSGQSVYHHYRKVPPRHLIGLLDGNLKTV